MTGLDTQNDQIIEIATIVTDNQLNLVAEGPSLAIHQSDETLTGMDEWNSRQHYRSGLVDRVRNSTLSESDAEQRTLMFIAQHVPIRTSPMCGNSVCQDRRFMARWMPELEAFFHYRNLDVSTVKELASRWYPRLPKFEKSSSHLAMADIRASIEELRYYRQRLMIDPQKL
jgi:oligoribonuclease